MLGKTDSILNWGTPSPAYEGLGEWSPLRSERKFDVKRRKRSFTPTSERPFKVAHFYVVPYKKIQT